MWSKKLVITLFLGLVSLAAASPARAGLRFCNRTSEVTYVAIEFYNPGSCDSGWSTRGWWRLIPGECKTAIGGDLTNRYYYYYAEWWNRQATWSGTATYACVPQPAFYWCSNTCSTASRRLGFRIIDTGSYTDYTLNLTR